MSDVERIYFVGGQATGKTTLSKLVAKRLGLARITETARSVLADVEVKGGLAALRGKLEEVDAYQREVFRRQLETEERYSKERISYVSDRAFDNLAYAALRADEGTFGELVDSPGFGPYMDRVRASRVFFCRPAEHMVAEDGVRSDADWEAVVRVDGIVLGLLASLRVRYVPVEGDEVVDRLRVVLGVLRGGKP